jgi:hypothetical protein
MKTILRLLAVSLLLTVFSNTTLNAQTCPGGKTAFVWVNGIWVPTEISWKTTVNNAKDNFFASRPAINSSCVVFDSVWNTSKGAFDLGQSFNQWTLEGASVIPFLSTYSFPYNINFDPDYQKVVDKVNNWSGQGYRVVLIGHSQGTFFTKEVYEHLATNPPDVRKLSVINIASAASYINNGIERYITHCGDVIRYVPGSLPTNFNPQADLFTPCPNYTIGEQIYLHLLEESYLGVSSSSTKQQIYNYLEDSLPDPGCGTDTNCFLRDNFNSTGYTKNFTKVDYGVVDNGNPIITSSGGILRMVSQPASPYFSTGHLTLNTRRYFVGSFTANLEYSSFGSGVNDISLVNAKNDNVVAHWALAPITSNTNWYPLTFTKTNSQIVMYVNGTQKDSVTTTSTSGYYLRFDLQGNNTLQIRNLSVVAGATPPSTTGTVKATVSGYSGSVPCSLNGVSVTAPFTFTKNQGSYSLSCTAPSGYNVSVLPATTQPLTAGGTINFTVALAQITTGTIKITVNPDANTTHSAVNCSINNGPSYAVTYSTRTITAQAPGSKTVTCDYPVGYGIASITPSATQTLKAGQTISFQVNLKLPPPLFLSYITVDTEPKINTNIRVSLYGAGFVGDTEVYFCTSSSTSSCTNARVSIRAGDGTKVTTKYVFSSTPRTLYIRAKNPNGVWSGYKTMVVIK